MKKELKAGSKFILSIFLFLSLFSYQASDPGLFSEAFYDSAKNYCGLLGSYSSDFLFSLFGIAIFLLPLVVLKKTYDEFKKISSSSESWIYSFLSIWALSSIISIDTKEVSYFGQVISAGGIIGSLTSALFVNYLNKIGAYLFSIGIFTLTLIGYIKTMHDNNQDTIVNVLKNIFKKVFKYQKEPQFVKVGSNNNFEKSPIFKKIINIRNIEKKQKPVLKKTPNSYKNKENNSYQLPTGDILVDFKNTDLKINKDELIKKSKELEDILAAYKIEGQVVEVLPGPVITMYEFEPACGIKVNQISNLSDDIAMKLKAESVRIIAPIPGKGAVGIEVPNKRREVVYFKDVYENDYSWLDKNLPLVLGKTIEGEGYTTDLTQMPHLLMAGTTGSGKSVSINAMICSILFTKTPDEVRMIMIDPKAIEFSSYENIPHLLLPVITDAAKANFALKWAVNEMEKRYRMMLELNVRKLDSFNDKIKLMKDYEIEDLNKSWFFKNNPEKKEALEVPSTFKRLPYIVIVIDELADLMFVAAKEVEVSIARLAQKARASGIHLLVATQRPSTDVITGLIKANFSSRIAFRVASKIDSRIILDNGGAESLLGHGDMLFVPPGTSRLNRIHGAYLSDDEVETIANFWKEQAEPEYINEDEVTCLSQFSADNDGDKTDELFDKAVEIVAMSGQASISMLQRKLSIGYNRSAKIIEMMEEKKMIGPSDGVKPREVYVSPI